MICLPSVRLEQSALVSKPLLVAHGAKDQRVPLKESDSFVKALKEDKKEVKYIVFEEESHFIGYWNNIFRLLHEIELFLAKHLGGRTMVMDGIER